MIRPVPADALLGFPLRCALRRRLHQTFAHKMTKALDNFFWHDGNLIDVSFAIDKEGKSGVQVTALFYRDEKATSRDTYQIRCKGISRFNCTLDFDELTRNMFAGNISGGYLKENTLWLYFTDGLLEIHAKQFRLTKC